MSNPIVTDPPWVPGRIAIGTEASPLLEVRADALYDAGQRVAPLASPALTGTPTAPTASSSDNSTRIATTAHVKARLDATLVTYATAASTLTEDKILVGGGNKAVASSALGLADLALASGGTLLNPALTGAPTTTTPPADSDSTRVANTAWVLDRIEAAGHTQNTDTKLDEGGDDEISASALWYLLYGRDVDGVPTCTWLNDDTVAASSTWSSSKITSELAEITGVIPPSVTAPISAVTAAGLPSTNPTLKILRGDGTWWQHSLVAESDLPASLLDLPGGTTTFLAGDGTFRTPAAAAGHTQNTDGYLDLGGASEVAANEIRAALDQHGAHQIVYGNASGVRVPLTISEATMLGRQTGGSISAIAQVSAAEKLNPTGTTALRAFSPNDIYDLAASFGGGGTYSHSEVFVEFDANTSTAGSDEKLLFIFDDIGGGIRITEIWMAVWELPAVASPYDILTGMFVAYDILDGSRVAMDMVSISIAEENESPVARSVADEGASLLPVTAGTGITVILDAEGVSSDWKGLVVGLRWERD